MRQPAMNGKGGVIYVDQCGMEEIDLAITTYPTPSWMQLR